MNTKHIKRDLKVIKKDMQDIKRDTWDKVGSKEKEMVYWFCIIAVICSVIGGIIGWKLCSVLG